MRMPCAASSGWTTRENSLGVPAIELAHAVVDPASTSVGVRPSGPR